jgi:hypothetical protein
LKKKHNAAMQFVILRWKKMEIEKKKKGKQDTEKRFLDNDEGWRTD